MHKKIGIIGGGQLGKMSILEGKKLGLSFVILDPSSDCPASTIVDEQIVDNYFNEEKIKELADKTDILTFEFEHINADYLMRLESMGYKIYPSPSTLKMVQDKYQQKTFLNKHDIPTPRFMKVDSVKTITEAIKDFGLPLVLKSCTGGYDGKGNYLIRSHNEIELAYETLSKGSENLMVEEFVKFNMEISALVARDINGKMEIYPLAENIHKDNILIRTIVPARINKEIEKKAKALALKTMEHLKGVGVFCIEMFVSNDGDVLINEIAPRTHNSGHYTIEACRTSQFSQHLRAILELPLGSTELLKPAVMVNILGEEGFEGKTEVIGLEETLKIAECNVHIYGKKDTSGKRKMGHVTILEENLDKALEISDMVLNTLKVISS
ncbi:5-(carboxyamino)imidazole ribonucleotide synthase [Serpentinicella alkaliphila]|uniref:N5-carboxyaminoimidazole ribonucleotide synthase n=1 Tax=Serpentinicella alkaliphila TaxID=1734049 RepID=A0A4R2U090_9FIRM|nr:5-(carboxyamino)imidazole ribonucleotide synthase [Serpentinicella alkaliphila]QUH24851.1 5-(carboxyamino)imidazole ribonucleotide synthase [Serpentinicella alkaliphila]TCQ03439.1 5-(carboxyamino)imidazole ribonucleotide synthase [Serpentinicella alkaliphila]